MLEFKIKPARYATGHSLFEVRLDGQLVVVQFVSALQALSIQTDLKEAEEHELDFLSLQKELDEVKDELGEVREECADESRENEKLESRIGQLENRNSDSDDDNCELRDRVNNLEKENKELEEKNQELEEILATRERPIC